MIDAAERTEWFTIYRDAAFEAAPPKRSTRDKKAMIAWAAAMAAIAEQFCDDDDAELVE